MDAKTLTALEKSIAKWERVVAGQEGDMGALNCALCLAFPGSKCIGCPVSEFTGLSRCVGTPYETWSVLMMDRYAEQRVPESQEELAAAQAELDFLRSLLPKELEGKP